MNELVFIEPNKIDLEPFTTSKIVAEVTGVTHKKIKIAITKRKKELETFGKVVSYGTTLESGQTEMSYHLNEQQVTLLITFLKNTPVVIAFKTELVRQFYVMRSELNKRHILREQLKPIRRELSDIIKEMPGYNQWAYKNFTDLAYKNVLGKTARQVRTERGATKNAKAVEYLTAEEIKAVKKAENQIAVLIEMGMDYKQIKHSFQQVPAVKNAL